MGKQFDRRVVSSHAIAFVRECQAQVPCHLGGGAALSGTILAHRLSRDIDLFVHEKEAHRDLVAALPDVAERAGARVTLLRDSGGHVRGRLELGSESLELDVVHEALPDLAAAEEVESVLVESERDLRASKITCILSRSEPRDLVDLLFLERAGQRPEDHLEDALRKDGGIDPGVLAWLLRSFPVEPLPKMLVPFDVQELRGYRDALADRFKMLAKPPH
jgi:hypothetical protein